MLSQPRPTRILRISFGATVHLILTLLLIVSLPIAFHQDRDNDSCFTLFADAFSSSRLSILSLRRIQQRQYHPADSSIGAAIPFFVDIENDLDSFGNDSVPAFLIEPISKLPPSGDTIYKTISNLCIDVFFKELLDPSGKGNVNFLKEWQITYLKNLQAADLERRRDRYEDRNEMFLAYEVKKSTSTKDALSQPLLMEDELQKAWNMEGRSLSPQTGRRAETKNGDSECYVRGDLLGFVEITQKPYGLGKAVDESILDGISPFNERPLRPVLTNLAVLKAARKYGIGSKLLEACEQHVRKGWKMNEIVLEVEDYNENGLAFYRQRGYEVLFSDPASRRYDIQGFWLNKVRCRREIMRKVLVDKRSTSLMESADSLIRRIRERVGNF